MKTPIRIMTLDFNLLAEIDNYESLMITREFYSIGTLEMRINRYKKHTDKLQRHNIIFPHNYLNKGYIILHKEIELNEDGKASENWLIRALSLKSWFTQRITYPPSHTAYDNKSDVGEVVMRHYVNNNVINPANIKRKMNDIALVTNYNRGKHVTWQSRYKNLAEELAEIGLQSELGWRIDIDYGNEKYVFNVLEGRNLSANQSTLPPAIFSTDYDTLKSLNYVESDLDYKNVAVVAGQGEGVDRRIIEVGDKEGFDRIELFVDARDVEEEDENDNPLPIQEINNRLINRGEQKLNDHAQEIYLSGEILTKSILKYQEDYDLGDIITLQEKEWGVTLDARITSITEVYEPEGFTINIVLDNDRPTIITKIKQALENIQSEIRR